MDGLAASIAERLGALPALGPFLFGTGPLMLALAGVLFALRNTTVLRFLRTRLEALLGILLAVILLAMVFLSGLQILLRNLLETGLLWIDPLLRHLVLLMAFTGAVVATGAKRHVQINVLGRLLRGGARRVSGMMIALISLGTCLALAQAGLELLRDEIEFSEVLFLDIPSWIVVGVFPVAFFTLAFRFAWLVFAELAGEAPEPVEVEMELPERAAP